MNKTESILMIERLREGIRKLPADADIYGFDLRLDCDTMRKVIAIHLTRPVENALAVPSRRYSGWHEMRLPLLPDVYCWWAENDKEADNGESA